MFLSFYVGIESTHFYTVIYHLYLGSDSRINEEIFPHLKFHQKLQNSSNISGFLLAVSNHLTGVMFSHKPQRIALKTWDKRTNHNLVQEFFVFFSCFDF